MINRKWKKVRKSLKKFRILRNLNKTMNQNKKMRYKQRERKSKNTQMWEYQSKDPQRENSKISTDRKSRKCKASSTEL